MNKCSDASTRELARVQLKLRDELIFVPRQYGDQTYYHIEVPSRSKHYRIGLSEYTFVSLLDGQTSVAEALTRTARTLGSDAFSANQAASICSWLLDTGLAHIEGTPQSVQLQTAARTAGSRRLANLNPLWMKIPLFGPDRLLDRLTPLFGWIHSPLAMALWLVICVWSCAVLPSHWDRLVASSAAILAPSNWIWLGVTWIALKVVHEFSHGLACKRYGGEVREMGVIFILLAPVAYVDVTSSWRFRSRWERVHTALAGMYVELFIAAVAAIVWTRTDSPVWSHLLYNVVFMASLSTLLFNANPLMRFDGYYILADALNIPNLYTGGIRYVQTAAARIFFGTKSGGPREAGAKGAVIRCYGVMAFLWRILICISLTLAASTLFHGAGLALAALAVAFWLGRPIISFSKAVATHHRASQARTVRLVIVGSLTAAALGYVLLGVPWPGVRTGPGVVEHEDTVVVRATSAGFVTRIHVRDGQLVKKGDLLIEQENRELTNEYRDLELAIAQSEAKRRILVDEEKVGQAQIEEKNREAYQQRLAEKKRQVDGLLVRAPVDGRVMARDLNTRKMTYLKEGAEIMAIGDPSQMQLRVSIAEEDAERFRERVGQTVRFRIRAGQRLEGKLTRITPRASREPFHPALCAPVGGPIAVKVKERTEDPEDSFQLVKPRFTGFVELPSALPDQLQAGQLGQVLLRTCDESIGKVIYYKITGWMRDKLAQAQSRR